MNVLFSSFYWFDPPTCFDLIQALFHINNSSLSKEFVKSHHLNMVEIISIYSSRKYHELEINELLFFQAFYSFLETHFQRSKFNSQALCLFFGNLKCWHIRLIICTPDNIVKMLLEKIK